MRYPAWFSLSVAVLAVTAVGQEPTDGSYRQQIEAWRQEHQASLKSERGWLTVAGLFWLQEGENLLGSAADCRVLLPTPAPAHVGSITLRDGHTTLHVDSGVVVTVKAKPVETMELKSDADGPPDKIEIGGLMFKIIKRGARLGVRLYDPNAKTLRDFKGLNWFPIDPTYRVTATFTPYDPPRKIPIVNILGDTELDPCPGFVTFELKGKQYKLDAVDENPNLFFILHDLTSGDSTYPAGRFLYSDMPKDGKVVLDFNKAENPPCAFTAYATCPLPPKQNYLEISVLAGEKTHHTDE